MKDRNTTLDRMTNWVAKALIGLAMAMPHRMRVGVIGWIFAHIVGPVAGINRRIRTHLAAAMPDLSEAETRRICHGVADNMGRTVIETYAFRDLLRVCENEPLVGSGSRALEADLEAGRPVILVSGHFGNYNALRASLSLRGHETGAIFRPFDNRFANVHYRAAIERFGPSFARGSGGTAEMVRHLKSGKPIAILSDQHVRGGEPLKFFGRSAATATSAARLAKKYGAALFPVYGLRRADGLHFDLIVEEPIPHGDPAEMTQALNDSLEAMVRKHPDQWMWSHRRWKLAEGRR